MSASIWAEVDVEKNGQNAAMLTKTNLFNCFILGNASFREREERKDERGEKKLFPLFWPHFFQGVFLW